MNEPTCRKVATQLHRLRTKWERFGRRSQETSKLNRSLPAIWPEGLESKPVASSHRRFLYEDGTTLCNYGRRRLYDPNRD